jgi:hypothetical protein
VQQLGRRRTRNNALIARARESLCGEQRKSGTKLLAAVLQDEAVYFLEQRDVRLETFGEASLEIRPGLTQEPLDFLVQGV